MGALIEIGTYIIQTLLSLYLLIVMLRFLFQIVRADFYNPLSQFVVSATKPLLTPLRRLIPGIYGIDLAALALALLIQWLAIQLVAFINGFGLVNLTQVLLWASIGLLSMVVNIFFWSLIIVVISSWLAPHSYNPVLVLVRQLTEPVTAPFQRLIPPLGGLDMSPIFAFLALNVARIIVNYFAKATMLPNGLVLGI